MNLRHHASLTAEKWCAFPFFRQILMIANELNRAAKSIAVHDPAETKLCYERAMELAFLTIEGIQEKRKRRELLRFYEMLAALFINPQTNPRKTNALLQVLVSLDKNSYCALKPSVNGHN